MTITQTVDIPADRRITLEVPREIPSGPVILTFTLVKEEKAADTKQKPISQFIGILSPDTFGDGVAYQRKIRDEWDG